MEHFSYLSLAVNTWFTIWLYRSSLLIVGALAMVALLTPLPSAAEVKCSCKTINAEGEGNTSCSANESGGRCTIDYNLFAEREVRAADFLKEKLGVSFIPFPEASSQEALRLAELKATLFEQIFLYLNVAAVSQLMRHPDTVNSDNFSEFSELLKNVQPQVEEAFSQNTANAYLKDSGPSGKGAVLVNSDGVVISNGCIEMFNDDQWIMFKAFWSPLSQSPRCLP